MSSMQRLSSFETSSKKKFGKNLNKIQKPPAPPIARDNGRLNSASSSSSRNGLMLLSTTKTRSSSSSSSLLSSSLNLNTAAASSSGGISAAAGTGTGTGTGFVTKGLLSTKRNQLETTSTSSTSTFMGTFNGTLQNPSKESVAWGTTTTLEQPKPTTDLQLQLPPQNSRATTQTEFKIGTQLQPHHKYTDFKVPEPIQHQQTVKEQNHQHHHHDSLPPSDSHSQNGIHPDQVTYMSRLARERAEKHRNEEQARMNEQRERAAQRLRELEQRIDTKQTHKSQQPAPPVRTLYDPNRDHPAAPRALYDPNEITVETRPRSDSKKETATRALYDPSRPFNAMVGETKEENTRPRIDSTDDTGDEVPSGPVIHLSSYDDRDRGERKANNGPRMLYDPKSGSMVAVTPDKGKKGKQKGRKEANGDAPQNGKKKGKTKKDEAPSKKDSPKMKGKPSNKQRTDRLPRTCGALYLRDENGKCYSADGQEGDQGYGCHCVPGGSLRNPIAYEKYLKQERQIKEQQDEEEEEEQPTQQPDDFDMEYPDFDDVAYMEPPATPNDDFTIDYVKADEKIELLTGAPESPTLQATAKEWAPSHTALTKVAHAKLSTGSVSLDTDDGGKSMTDDDEDDFDDDLDDPTSFIGLGFDPTENMDSVIQSPSIRGQAARLEGLDLEALALTPASTAATAGSSLFAFGTSSTWGNHKADGDSWAVTESQEKTVSASPFLSLNTWGSSALPGLGGGDSGAVAD